MQKGGSGDNPSVDTRPIAYFRPIDPLMTADLMGESQGEAVDNQKDSVDSKNTTRHLEKHLLIHRSLQRWTDSEGVYR